MGKLAELIGEKPLKRRLTNPTWMRKPTGTFLASWYETFKREAIERVPVWSGRLKRGIQAERDSKAFPLWARVFVNEGIPEARPMEFGAGLLSDAPDSQHQRFFPPPKESAPGAISKGLNPWAVASGIYKRGGLEPRHYFRDAEQAADAH